MNKLQKMREFLATCPLLSVLADGIHVDWTADAPENFGIMPTGEVVVDRKENVLGEVFLLKQYNFSLFARMFTPNDVSRLENCGFFEDFIDWIEEQQVFGNVPAFGGEEFGREEMLTAQNGILYDLDEGGDTGTYQIQLQKTYKIRR